MENSYFYWSTDKNYLHRYLIDTFCKDCKLCPTGGASACNYFIFSSGVCIAFEWKNLSKFNNHKEEVLESQAQTLQLKKGLSLAQIHKLHKKQLLSILNREHYNYFENRIKLDQERTSQVREIQKLGFKDSESYRAFIKKQEGSKRKQDLTEPKIEVEIKKDNQLKHYFYTKNEKGVEKIYSKRTNSKGYKSDVTQLRKFFINNNIVLIREDIK